MRVARDEIDIVALEPGSPPTLVFVEVRSNHGGGFGTPEEGVGAEKLRNLYRAAFAFRRERGRTHLPWRVDLVAVELAPRLRADAGGPVVRHLRGVA